MLDCPAPGIRRLLAPNPSPMTGPGTNGYIVGTGVVAVIDPGPDDDRHLDGWLDALAGEESHILVTHAHLDHSGLARGLSDVLGAPVAAFGPREAGRTPMMQRLASLPGLAGGEGADRVFVPDLRIGDGDVIAGPGWRIEVLHIPGHFAGHLAFAVGDVVLTGDHVLGWTSTLISPPDGDLRQFLESCDRLSGVDARMLLPGHGAPITDPVGRLAWLVDHRRNREAQILAELSEGDAGVAELVDRLYADTPLPLRSAAARSVLAHLVALFEEGRVVASPRLDMEARYSLA